MKILYEPMSIQERTKVILITAITIIEIVHGFKDLIDKEL